jgi:hypothetical protein
MKEMQCIFYELVLSENRRFKVAAEKQAQVVQHVFLSQSVL